MSENKKELINRINTVLNMTERIRDDFEDDLGFSEFYLTRAEAGLMDMLTVLSDD